MDGRWTTHSICRPGRLIMRSGGQGSARIDVRVGGVSVALGEVLGEPSAAAKLDNARTWATEAQQLMSRRQLELEDLERIVFVI